MIRAWGCWLLGEQESGVSEKSQASGSKGSEPPAVWEVLLAPVIDGPESMEAAQALIKRMESLKKELEALCALSQMERFFEGYGDQEPITLKWNQVGTGPRFLSAYLKKSGFTTSACGELAWILNPWVAELTSKGELTLSPDSALRALGERMVGAEAFERWRAQVERGRLDASAGPGRKRAAGPGL